MGHHYITRKLTANILQLVYGDMSLLGGRVLPLCVFISFYPLLAQAPQQQQWQPVSLLWAPPHTKLWIWRTGRSGQSKCANAEHERSFRAKGHSPVYLSWTYCLKKTCHSQDFIWQISTKKVKAHSGEGEVMKWIKQIFGNKSRVTSQLA